MPNTARLSRMSGIGTGEIARMLKPHEYAGFIVRIPGRRRDIRLCSPSVKMAPDDHLVAELTRCGYLVRKGPGT